MIKYDCTTSSNHQTTMDVLHLLSTETYTNETSKVADTQYLKTVKSMDYDEFCDVLASVIPDLYKSLPRFQCDDWYEFMSFTVRQQTQSRHTLDDMEYVIRECKVEYPVTLTQLGQEYWKLEGISPQCFSMFASKHNIQVFNIPLVIETNKTSKTSKTCQEDLYHQTILVFDLRPTKQVAFLYDPNGHNSRFDVHYAIQTYVNLLNIATTPIKYIKLHNSRINLYHKSMGGGHCVVCCILFMISYTLLDMNVDQHDAMLLKQKSILTKLHILLYNALGYELKRIST